jgi:hypothetical protein
LKSATSSEAHLAMPLDGDVWCRLLGDAAGLPCNFLGINDLAAAR